MSPQARRRIIPILVLLAAAGILLAVIFGPKRQTQPAQDTPETNTQQVEPKDKAAKSAEPAPVVSSTEQIAEAVKTETGKLSLKRFPASNDSLVLGSLDDYSNWGMQASFTSAGAGIDSIRFSNIFETVDGKLAWDQFRSEGGTQPTYDDLYLLGTAKTLQYQTSSGLASATASILGASQVVINDHTLHLTNPDFWQVTTIDESTIYFTAEVIAEDGSTVATIHRDWFLGDQYGLTLKQRISNITNGSLSVRWLQYGPQSLVVDRSRYMDRRRFRFGWELSEEFDPNQAAPIQSTEILYEYADATKLDSEPLWPTEETEEDALRLSWFASTNRYFALAVLPNVDQQGVGSRTLTDKVEIISSQVYGDGDSEFILTALWSPETIVAPNTSYDLSMDVYAGPMKRSILDNEQPYIALNMRELVLYQMSSMCAICTFQWLADLLAWVLTFLDQHVVFDWGIAIICLVLIVRGLLHPITKKSQINMQRFGKVMQKIKPEIDKIKAKYPDDPKKAQTEQMRLMQQYGVNPFMMLGCLPMFLQMPVWIALYALLYFMFDIRQEPAFFGVFQMIGEWPFLADLSAADHFFGEFDEPFQFFLWNITGINILPILMGAIFYVQQKYMSPQVATTPEQESQQKIMRVMMVVMFPLMLYSAPSGLTLYILTSSAVGILESRRVRLHLDGLDIEPQKASAPRKGKPKDKQGRAWADAMEARRKKVQNKAKKRNFKKRD